MDYAEASYPFPGIKPHHFHHIAARDEHNRLTRIADEGRKLMERRSHRR